MRASLSLVVIGFVLATSISTVGAQYFPPQPPPMGYPPPTYYPYRPSPPPPDQNTNPYPDADEGPYDDPYYRPSVPQPRRPPDNISSAPLPPPALSPQDHGATAVAALPPDYQPEQGPAKLLPPQFRRTVVDYPTIEPPGTIIIDTPNTYLYLTLGNGKAIRYGVGVGREGFNRSGTERVSRMKEWRTGFRRRR